MFRLQSDPVFWKTILDTMTEGLMLIEEGGKIVFINRAMELLTGFSHDELVGRRCSVLDFDCCPRMPGKEQQGPCSLFKEGHLIDKHCSLKRKDGTLVTVLKNARVIPDPEGHSLCAVEVQSDLTRLRQTEKEVLHLRNLLCERYGFHGIVGTSPQMRTLFDLMSKAATSDAPVLMYGESGTGKELVAAAIHRLGKKSKGPFIRVSCAALSESLLESELFGHVRGAYTGADRTTKGRFEAAHTGDIFLDEIGDVPLSIQVKLLRVIEQKEVERVGDYRPVPIDVRIIAATHRDLRALMARGLFRDDLFYRLNVIPIVVPPLRERPGDVPLLVSHFIRQISARTGKCITGVDREAMEVLTRYNWPGNIRELINVIEYALVVCAGDTISRGDLPELTRASHTPLAPAHNAAMRRTSKERLIDALIVAKGKRGDAARVLGVSRQTVWSLIKKHGIDVDRLCSQPTP
ncbi:MAG: PAS domain S-box protein [Deltaproteobacteria bacterium]|nr:PAS domain S-box protein [Deltaproteobacteria bacterium]